MVRRMAPSTPQTDEERAYNRGWADGNASALDACNPIIRDLQARLGALREVLANDIEALPTIFFTDEQDPAAGDVVYRADVLAIVRPGLRAESLSVSATENPAEVMPASGRSNGAQDQ